MTRVRSVHFQYRIFKKYFQRVVRWLHAEYTSRTHSLQIPRAILPSFLHEIQIWLFTRIILILLTFNSSVPLTWPASLSHAYHSSHPFPVESKLWGWMSCFVHLWPHKVLITVLGHYRHWLTEWTIHSLRTLTHSFLSTNWSLARDEAIYCVPTEEKSIWYSS